VETQKKAVIRLCCPADTSEGLAWEQIKQTFKNHIKEKSKRNTLGLRITGNIWNNLEYNFLTFWYEKVTFYNFK